MANTNICNNKKKNQILENNFIQNYDLMQNKLNELSNLNILTGDLDITFNSRKSFSDNETNLSKYINIEKKNQKKLDVNRTSNIVQ